MDAGGTLLRDPGQPAIECRDDAAVGADCPPVRGAVTREGNRIEMIFGWRANLSPFLSGVFGDRNRAPRSDHHRALRILHKKTIEIGDDARPLALPLKASIRGVKNHAVGAYGPTVALVLREANGADGVALRARVLPFPAAVGYLGERRYGDD